MRVAIISADRTSSDGSASNIGDALLTDALALALADRGVTTTIADFGDARTTTDLPRRRLAGFSELVRFLRESDGVIVGGGTLFQDDAPSSVVGGLPRLCLAASLAAAIAKKPLVFFGVGCDPMRRRLPRWMLKLATLGRPVWVRDERSAARFREYFSRTPNLGADVSLLALHWFTNVPTGFDAGVTVALNRRDAAQLTADNRQRLAAGGKQISLVSMDQRAVGGDEELLVPDVSQHMRVVARGKSWREIVSELAASEVIVASRMHALYVGMMLEKPLVALGGSAKVTGFASEFAVPQLVHLASYELGVARPADPKAVANAAYRASESLEAALRHLRRRGDGGPRKQA